MRDEGQWDEDNLVISCKMCNGDRDAKGLSPMEFWEWLQVPENLASYDKRRAILLKFHRSPYRQDTLKRRHAKQPMTRVYITR